MGKWPTMSRMLTGSTVRGPLETAAEVRGTAFTSVVPLSLPPGGRRATEGRLSWRSGAGCAEALVSTLLSALFLRIRRASLGLAKTVWVAFAGRRLLKDGSCADEATADPPAAAAGLVTACPLTGPGRPVLGWTSILMMVLSTTFVAPPGRAAAD